MNIRRQLLGAASNGLYFVTKFRSQYQNVKVLQFLMIVVWSGQINIDVQTFQIEGIKIGKIEG